MRILRWIDKALGGLVLLVAVAIAIFAALNWKIASNMAVAIASSKTDVEAFQPAQKVAGCPSDNLAINTAGFDSQAFAAMKAYSDEHDGMGLVVMIDGVIVGEDYREGAGASTRSQSESMHKPVVAMALGRAVADGIVSSPDAPIESYLTQWQGQPRGEATFRQLLGMSSGLENLSTGQMDLRAFNLVLGDASEAAFAVERQEPAGRFNYSNVSYQIAGTGLSRALEEHGGRSYAEYLSETIWCPLGNGDAVLWLESEEGQPRYFAFLNGTVRDWARIGELIRNRGEWQDEQLIPAEWIDTMLEPAADNPNYGLGIWLGSPWTKDRRYSDEVSLTVPHREPYLAEDVYFIDGYGGQRVYIVPSAGLVISRSGNPSHTWDDSILPNIALKAIAANSEPDEGEDDAS